MLRLMLLRHAKSSWSDPELRDHERPLNGRGRKAAGIMGRFMAAQGLIPELILCSPAIRTRQTLELAGIALPDTIEIRFIGELYDFGDGSAIIEVLRTVKNKPSPLLVVGHNPSMEGAALSLAKAGPSPERKRMAEKYPTGALAVIDLPIAGWDEIRMGIGELTSFTTPRELGG